MTDLLAPRFLITNDWPGNQFLVGDIFTFVKTFDFEPADGKTGCWYDQKNGVFIETCEKYPHLFKPLPWYEKRQEGDMPVFLKDIGDGEIFKVESYKYSMGMVRVWRNKKNKSNWIDVHETSLEHFQPATESEYLSYIKSKQ